MTNDDLSDIQAEEIRDLEIKLKDLQFLLDECRPWMRSEETPAQCTDRLNGEAIKALERQTAALDKFLALKRGVRNLVERFEL